MTYVTETVHIKDVASGRMAELMNEKDAEGYEFLFMVNYGNTLCLTFKRRGG